MNKLLIAVMLSSLSINAIANDTCKKLLEDTALTIFDTTEHRDPDVLISVQADMSPRYKKVIVYQYKAQYVTYIQLENDDSRKCEIMGLTPFEEI